jgi:hypothetical protein
MENGSRPYLAEIPNVSVHVSENPHTLPLARKTLGFIGKTSRMIGEDFVASYSANRAQAIGNPNPPSLDFLIKRNLHLPQFGLLDAPAAGSFLEAVGFDYEIEPENLLLVFQFPQLTTRWSRRKYEENKPDNSVIDWGKFSFPFKKVVWNNIKLYSELSQELVFNRINEEGKHDSRLYHYVWEVSLPEAKKEYLRRSGGARSALP